MHDPIGVEIAQPFCHLVEQARAGVVRVQTQVLDNIPRNRPIVDEGELEICPIHAVKL